MPNYGNTQSPFWSSWVCIVSVSDLLFQNKTCKFTNTVSFKRLRMCVGFYTFWISWGIEKNRNHRTFEQVWNTENIFAAGGPCIFLNKLSLPIVSFLRGSKFVYNFNNLKCVHFIFTKQKVLILYLFCCLAFPCLNFFLSSLNEIQFKTPKIW